MDRRLDSPANSADKAFSSPARAQSWELLRRLALYGAVGVLNTVIGFGIIAILDFGLGVNSHLANALGYAAGLVTSFVLNRIMVFRSQETAARSGPRFLIAAAACFGLNQLVLAAGLAVLGHEPPGRLISQGLGMVSYTVALFGLCQFWVFPQRRAASAA
jgi:putative flippase GtrA